MEEPIQDIDDSFGKLSKINSAGIINSTLGNLWNDFFRHFRDGRYLSANNDLDCIWTIHGGEKKVEGSEEERSYFLNEKDLSKSGNLQNSISIRGFGEVSDKELNKLIEHKGLLLKKALILRRLQNKQGKGTAYTDEDEGDFD